MPKIFELDSHVADLIAAGEVVERPASVVKELVENSIDAGASIVTVEISAGGMTFIRVTDNGCGISPEDVKTAFLRHATSKLRGADGLEAIGTLGFRGEALAAIAAVSRIELLTREHGAKEGVSLSLVAGEIVDFSPAGCPEGTTIIVRDLFFNTPARLKFMKSDRAESSAVASIVLRCAMSRPDVSVRFIKDGKSEYHTPGDSRTDSCIYSLLGREFSEGLLSADTSDEAVTVTGFVSSPDAARGNRSYQFFFVNGRPIKSLTLQAALEQACKNLLPSGRFPSCVLYITTRLGDVDVNVHPAKTEVKFVSDKQVFDGVHYAALGALSDKNIIRNQQSTITNQWSVDEKPPAATYKSEPKFSSNSAGKLGSGNATHDAFKSMQVDEFRKKYGLKGNNTPDAKEDRTVRHTESISDHDHDHNPQISNSEFCSVAIRVIGEALSTYVIVEYESSIWFIDKHAAHERLHFNALKRKGFSPMSQSLITPVICRHGSEEVSILLENTKLLDDLGFLVESFGEDAIAVRRIPAEIDIGDAESVLSEICSQLKHSGTADAAGHDDIFRTIACKAAIKAGKSSSMPELEALASKVMSGEASHCPHGRPVAFEITKLALDKGFQRR